MYLHERSKNRQDVLGFPVVQQYRYLGISIDNFGTLNPHFDGLSKRIHYLERKLGKYNKQLSIASKLTIWKSYISPHFLYISSALLHSGSKVLLKQVNTLWKKSIKNFIGLPRSTPDLIIQNISGDLIKWSRILLS
jgi:hypothetical protein